MLRRVFLFPFLAACLALPALAALGCNERQATTYPIWQPEVQPPPRTYNTTPESTSQLLQDSSEAVKGKYPSTEGVHFTLETLITSNGQQSAWHAEGDIEFPDRVKMAARNFLMTETVSQDAIHLEGQEFVKDGGADAAWHAGSPQLPTPDPQSIVDFLDFTRSSRNFGQETLAGGQKTWHVQVNVDTAMLAEAALNRTTDQSEAQRLDSLKADTVTVDFWIGGDDRLPQQMVVKLADPAASRTEQQTYVFSNWNEHPPIARPCSDC